MLMSYHIINDFEPDWDRAQCFLDAIAELEAKREWIGLTKDEVELWQLPESPTVFEFCQFVEAKLKEKNTL